MNHCASNSLTRLTSINKADIRALKRNSPNCLISRKKILLSLLNLRRHPSLIAHQILHVAATVLPHKLKSGVNPQIFNVIHAKILSWVRLLMHLQVMLYPAFAKKIINSIISSVYSIVYTNHHN